MTRLHFTVRVNGQPRPTLNRGPDPLPAEPVQLPRPHRPLGDGVAVVQQRGDALTGSSLDPK